MDIETTDEVLEKAVVAGLDGLDFITSYSTAEIAEAFNGIGPEFLTEGERERISKYLDLFTPAALIHDMRYTYNDGSRYGFYFANCEFRKNCLALANQKYSPFNWRRYRAHAAAEFLFAAVCSQAGWVAYRQAFTKSQKESK